MRERSIVTKAVKMNALFGQPFSSQQHRLHNLLIPGAAAQVAADGLAYLRFSGTRNRIEQTLRGNQHSRCAVAALQAVRLAKAVLQHTQGAVMIGQAFDCGDCVAVCLHREHQARTHRIAIEHNGTRAADAVFATDVGAGEPQLVA